MQYAGGGVLRSAAGCSTAGRLKTATAHQIQSEHLNSRAAYQPDSRLKSSLELNEVSFSP